MVVSRKQESMPLGIVLCQTSDQLVLTYFVLVEFSLQPFYLLARWPAGATFIWAEFIMDENKTRAGGPRALSQQSNIYPAVLCGPESPETAGQDSATIWPMARVWLIKRLT